VKLRRPFRRRKRGNPLDGIETIPGLPVERDPVDAIGVELLLAAERLRDKRARRARIQSRASVAALASILLILASSAASALGVKVPMVDELVDTLAGTSENIGKFAPDSSAELRRIRPGPGNSSERLMVPLDGGSKEVVGAAYVTVRGDVCFAVADEGLDPTGRRTSGLGCWLPRSIERHVARDRATVSGVSLDAAPIVAGYADDRVEAVSVTGPTGPLTVALTEPWTPQGLDSPRFRVFLAVAQSGPGTRMGLTSRQRARALDPRSYEIVARLRNGRVITVRR